MIVESPYTAILHYCSTNNHGIALVAHACYLNLGENYSIIMDLFCAFQLPVFFDGHHSYHIYDANMTFENNLSSFSWSSHNRQSYRMFLESSRLALRCSFSQMELDLIKITKDVDQGKIEARWRVRGRPIYLLSLKERYCTCN